MKIIFPYLPPHPTPSLKMIGFFFFISFPWMYALSFIILILSLPFWFSAYPGIFYLFLVINTSIFIAVTYFTHSRELSSWRGLRLLCGSFMSGFANLTILYIFFILAFYYIRAVIATFTGFKNGRIYTQNWWIETISNRIKSGSWNLFSKINNNNSNYNYHVDADAEGNLRLDFPLGFYEAIFGCTKEVQFQQLQVGDNGNLHPVIKSINVTFPPGVESGTRLRLSQLGDASPSKGKSGDLYIVVSVPLQEGEFKREGINIFSDVKISPKQAKLGGQIAVNTVDGQTNVAIPPDTNKGYCLTLTGRGVPELASPSHRGDHIVRIVF